MVSAQGEVFDGEQDTVLRLQMDSDLAVHVVPGIRVPGTPNMSHGSCVLHWTSVCR